ncbi:MAG: hypothetical protein KDC79_06840 [Cyclobacteriaceae bacterium]|nr:hypothetical protein [Cyclobacteriaceae bacterium]
MRSKIILAAVLMVFGTHLLSAQDKGTNEIGIGAGFATTNDFINLTTHLIVSGGSLGNDTYANTTFAPAFGVIYKKAISDRWLFYADGYYQGISQDVLVNDVKVGDVKETFLTVGFGTDYHYVSSDLVQLYSGVAVAYTSQSSDYTGASSDFEDGNDGFFNFQLNAIGLRVGKALAGYAELGVGYKGIANIGVSYQF